MEVIIGTSDNFEKEVLKAERVIIDFNAEWCGPCRMLGPILESVAKDLKKTKVVSVNVDDEEDLASEYNVFTIPCLVLLENGKEIKRNVGLISKEDLINFIGE
jgi:thioredoxin 1